MLIHCQLPSCHKHIIWQFYYALDLLACMYTDIEPTFVSQPLRCSIGMVPSLKFNNCGVDLKTRVGSHSPQVHRSWMVNFTDDAMLIFLISIDSSPRIYAVYILVYILVHLMVCLHMQKSLSSCSFCSILLFDKAFSWEVFGCSQFAW